MYDVAADATWQAKPAAPAGGAGLARPLQRPLSPAASCALQFGVAAEPAGAAEGERGRAAEQGRGRRRRGGTPGGGSGGRRERRGGPLGLLRVAVPVAAALALKAALQHHARHG